MSSKPNARKPFSSDFADSFFFSEPGRTQCVNMLLHLAPYSGDVLVVSGDLGVGKTAVIRQFAAKAPDSCRVCLVSAHKVHDVSAFFTVLQNSWPLRNVEPGDVEASAEKELRQLHAHGQRPVIIIDDAQNLSVELARLFDRWLANSEEGKDFFTLILVGKSGLEDLPSIKLLIRHGHHPFHIEPLSAEATRQYVHYQLEKANLLSEGFSPVELEIICATANGIPGLINAEARKFLNERAKQAHSPVPEIPAAATGSTQTTPSIPRSRYIFPVGILLTAAGIIAWWLWSPPPPQNSAVPPSDAASQKTLTQDGSQEAAEVATLESVQAPNDSSPQPSAGDVEMAMHELPDDIAPIAGELSPEQINAMLEERIARGKQDIPPWEAASDESLNEQDTSQTVGSQVVDDEPSPRSETLQPVSELASTVSPSNSAPAAARDPIPPPSVPTALDPPAPPLTGLKDTKWLLEQNPTHFTLQLVAYAKLDEIQRAANKLGPSEHTAYFPLMRNGKRLYAIVYGVYPSESSARAAISDIPKTLGPINPIVKTFRSVHKDIVVPAKSKN